MGALGFLYPGFNAEKVGMGKDFYNMVMSVRQLFESAEKLTGLKLMKICFYGPEDQLFDPVSGQVALFLVEVSAAMVLRQKHVTAQAQIGIGTGLYAALVNAGALEFTDALLLVKRRGELMKEAQSRHGGLMIQVSGAEETVLAAVSSIGTLDVAVRQNPEACILSGDKEGVVSFLETLRARSLPVKAAMVPHTGGWHGRLMAGVTGPMAEALVKIKVQPIKIPTVHPATGKYFGGAEEIKTALADEASRPVEWMQAVETIKADGCFTVIEAGAGQSLGHWMRLADRSIRTLVAEDARSLAATLKLST